MRSPEELARLGRICEPLFVYLWDRVGFLALSREQPFFRFLLGVKAHDRSLPKVNGETVKITAAHPLAKPSIAELALLLFAFSVSLVLDSMHDEFLIEFGGRCQLPNGLTKVGLQRQRSRPEFSA